MILAAVYLAESINDKPLQIYVVDVEGGNATLIVTPSGESVLIDAGNGGEAAIRDADRIIEAAKSAGLTIIDHLIITHWHRDHFGGVEELARQVPVAHYIDHGPNIQPTAESDDFINNVYPRLTASAGHTVAKAGDKLALKDVDWRFVSSAGQLIAASLTETANPACAESAAKERDSTENSQSIGSHIRFGRFRFVHLADLSYDKELALMCPNNRIGTVDLLIVSHHGQQSSNSPALIHALHPVAAIMNNGIRKGAQPETMKVLFNSPGLEDLWQMHFSLLTGQQYPGPDAFIANYSDAPEVETGQSSEASLTHNGKAFYFKITAQQDGRFTVTNSRNGFTKTYN
jgi:beta-lactamase superfamily II metal-dependent hydrolase